MNKRIENTNDLAQAVAMYVAAATDHGRATEEGDHKSANSSARRLAATFGKIRAFGAEGENAVIALLSHPNCGVRLWAASHALKFAPNLAERVLVELASRKNSLIGVSAEFTLREWRAGRLQSS